MKILRVFLCFILIFSIVFTAIFAKRLISAKNQALSQNQYKGIISIWHVDSFEGGKGSRKQFLMQISKEYEKQNPGILVCVIDQTFTSVKQLMDEGQLPDVLSFGVGVPFSTPNELDVDCDFKGGKINDKTYAIPWCVGGYALVTKKQEVSLLQDNHIENLIVSQGEYTQPMCALALEGYTANNVFSFSPIDAYVNFLSAKDSVMIATQRDLIRLENRGVDVIVKPLTKYNDLYQYVSVYNTDEQKYPYVSTFVDYLLSQPTQSKLDSIGMSSLQTSITYENDNLSNLFKIKSEYTVSPFTNEGALKNMQSQALQALKGNEQSLTTIKNSLVKCF